jgi:hypothetical protein
VSEEGHILVFRGDFGSGPRAELVPDAFEMSCHGARRDQQPAGDLLVGEPLGDQLGDHVFPFI